MYKRQQITLVTDRDKAQKILDEEAMPRYNMRDERLASMTDESVDRFYTCILCQSFAPAHCCVAVSYTHLDVYKRQGS